MKPLFSLLFSLSLLACGAPAGGGRSPSGQGAATKGEGDPAASRDQQQGPVEQEDGAAPGSSSDVPSSETPSSEEGAGEPLPWPEGTKVLHVGDSFAGALGRPLGSLFEEAGVRSVLKHTDASYLTDWAWDGKLQDYLWKYNPDLVLITLGANELEITEPDQRRKTIAKIISMIGDRPCVWVAIPLWQGPKNGLMDVISESVSPCVFMDTNRLYDVTKMPRIADGIHPTTAAREKWAKDVALWLRQHRAPVADKPWHMRAE